MFETMWRRLRHRPGLGLAFAVAAALLNSGTSLVLRLLDPHARAPGVELLAWLMHDWLPSMEGGLVILLCLRLSAEHGRDLARRPMRFGAVVVVGAILSTSLLWALAGISGRAPPIGSPELLPKLFDSWQQAMYCGTLVGWLYVLTLRRIEERSELTLLLARRSILRRQLTQSTLLARRAQIDPERVARVLEQIRQRHHRAPQQATMLLDHLISYLRLIMHRTRDKVPSALSELSLARSYLCLCEAETGIPIRWEEYGQGAAPNAAVRQPLFLVVQQLLALALAGGADRIEMGLQWQANGFMLRLGLGSGRLPPGAADSLKPFATLLPVVHENGANIYVVQFNAL